MDERNDYVEVLTQRLDELKKTIGHDREEVRDLLETIREKEEQVEYILKLLEADGITLGSEALDGAAPMSVSDMAYEVLSRQTDPTPIHYRDLAESIMAEGKLIPGQDPAANLISHLTRDERFMRVGRGMYALTQWGLEPAKPRSRRRGRRKRG